MSRRKFPLLLAAVAVLAVRARAVTPVAADIDSPDKRQQVVAMAVQLTRSPVIPAPMVADVSPFDPPGFSTPDPDEKAAARLAAQQAAAASGTKIAEVRSDKEILDKIAEKIVPTGTIFVGGRPMLMFGKKFVKVGTHFTVTFDGADYELILTSIDATTFSLRLGREVTTRPIQTGKSQ
jgi:hypothetical protein